MSEQAARSPSVPTTAASVDSAGKNITFFAVGFLWILWILSALPLASLILEFNDDWGMCGSEGHYYAKLYSHFFLYPVTFGFLSTVFLTPLWLRTVRDLWSLPDGTRLKVVSFLVASIVIVVGFISYLEFSGAHNTLAIWAVEQSALNESNSQKVSAAKKVLKEKRIKVDWRTSNKVKKKFEALGELRHESKSVTRVFYYFGFVAMTTLFAVLFVVVIIVRSSNRTFPMVGMLVPAVILASFWPIIRYGYLKEKIQLYGENADPLLMFNYFLFAAFVVLYAHVISISWEKFRVYEQVLKTLSGVVIAVVPVLGSWQPEFIYYMFGSRSSGANYVAAILLLLVIFAPNIIRLLQRDLNRLSWIS